jgi:CRISPR-associated protein Csb1
MPDEKKQEKKTTMTPSEVLRGESPLVLTAIFAPVGDQDRFQPAGFPEVGHVIYKAPRRNGGLDHVCIVDSAASMANHLESVCMRGPHDFDLVVDLAGMPYVRCVTDAIGKDGEPDKDNRELVVTSLTEGHRLASTYFLGARNRQSGKWDGKGGQRMLADGKINDKSFGDELAGELGVVLPDSKKAHPPAAKWWDVFKTIYKYDPNALVHGVLFPQWQIKISRVLTAHLEAFGAARVDRSGVKFDRLGKTTSGQPIFAVDDATAREIRATFVLDVALLRSFGRTDGNATLGLREEHKQFLAALALWKMSRLFAAPFRFRSGCHLRCVSLRQGETETEIDVNIRQAISRAAFRENNESNPVVTDIYWPREELYREGDEDVQQPGTTETGEDAGEEVDENE